VRILKDLGDFGYGEVVTGRVEVCRRIEEVRPTGGHGVLERGSNAGSNRENIIATSVLIVK
jgi:hypothetical protein